jgi:dihydroorotate dehydrogenase
MIYSALFELVLRWMPVEGAHRLAVLVMRTVARTPGCAAVLRRLFAPRDPALRVQALGLSFPSPLGVAAGMDKDAGWFEALGLLGFGFVEVGTVTARPQAGNPAPRVFRIVRDRALLNRMGFPNPGARAVAARLRDRSGPRPRRRSDRVIVGVNVGKSFSVPIESAAGDYRACVHELACACDYLVVNVSSPNTPGLREMQTVELLRPLLREVQRELAASAVQAPVLVKVGPDAANEQLVAIADLALELSLDGIVAVNTTEDRSALSEQSRIADVEGGGISGPPLGTRAVEVLRLLRERVGDRLVLISVGGISTAEDAWGRILAGATLVQAYTGFVYGGPGWPARVNRSLARRARAAGADSIQELVGGARIATRAGLSLAARPGYGDIRST